MIRLGLKSRYKALIFINDLIIKKGRDIFFNRLRKFMLRWRPLIVSKVCKRSLTGKTFDSKPNLDPTKWISVFGNLSFISSPIAIAGNKWPQYLRLLLLSYYSPKLKLLQFMPPLILRLAWLIFRRIPLIIILIKSPDPP